MKRRTKLKLQGFVYGAVSMLLLSSGMYYLENGKLPLIGDSLVTGYNAHKISTMENIIEEHFLGEVDKDALADYMCYGLMSGLDDRYSGYFSAEQYKKAMDSNNGVYTGVGLVMQQDSETKEVTIINCYKDSPAEQAGVLKGDILYKVNDQIASETTVSELGKLITENESVVLYLKRDGVEGLVEIEVAAAVVEVPSIYSRKLDNGMGYIQIVEFTDVTPDQFETAYEELLNENIKGLMIDVRENPGGLLSSVCDTLRQILPKGLIMYTEDKHGNRNEQKCEGKTPIEIPLVLLVNEESASAAEIFAAGVQDYGIGTLVGTTTFGKGIVQKYYSFSDGSAMKITIAKYYTPKGVCIHGEGIVPDIEAAWNGENEFGQPEDYNELSLEEWKLEDNQFAKGLEVLSGMLQ